MTSHRDDVTDGEARRARNRFREGRADSGGGATYADVLSAETPGELTESSLSRVWQHLESGDSWAIISAWRGARETLPEPQLQEIRAENNRRSENLESDLASMGYGYFGLKGRFKEQNEAGEEYWVQERSFFVPRIEREDAAALAGKYDQEAIIFGEPGDDGDIVMLEPSGGEMFTLGPNEGDALRPRKIADAYSRVKGHGFTFGDPPGEVRRGPALESERDGGLKHFHFEGVAHSFAEAMGRHSPEAGGHRELHDRITAFLEGG